MGYNVHPDDKVRFDAFCHAPRWFMEPDGTKHWADQMKGGHFLIAVNWCKEHGIELKNSEFIINQLYNRGWLRVIFWDNRLHFYGKARPTDAQMKEMRDTCIELGGISLWDECLNRPVSID